ncbi:MAG TPA: DUF1579 family protein [Planctomycetota bacterium]|nr:DUF1579 family protein [Planctomycetota bacterium]
MNTHRLAVALLLVLPTLLAAQETPKPAPKLAKLQPLIGSWHGTGTAQMGPGEPSKWESQSTYAWALGNFFVQEDTVVTFADMGKPLVMRSYLGWDAENRSYVSVGVDNDGTVGVHRIELLGDGSMVQMMESFHEGQTYFERYTNRIDGDSMTFAIDMMGAQGPAAQGVQGTMKRTDKAVAIARNAGAFTATPAPAITKLARIAGTYAVEAKMLMMPGAPPMNITGQDVVEKLFDGTVVHVHSTGKAEGHPADYVGEAFYGFDQKLGCIRAVFVSSMGEVGDMTGAFTDGGFVLTGAQRYMGQPCVQRMVTELGADGAPTKAIGHVLLGTSAPCECWNATYTKK